MTDIEQKCKGILEHPHLSILGEYTKAACPGCKGIIKYVLSILEQNRHSFNKEYLTKCPFCNACYLFQFEGIRKTIKKTFIPIRQEGLAEKIGECFDGLRSTSKIQRNKKRYDEEPYQGPESYSIYKDPKSEKDWEEYI